jgi:hypothetical protein
MSIVQTFQTRRTTPTTRLRGDDTRRRMNGSIAGILIFSSLGFGLSILAVVFNWLELPPPVF